MARESYELAILLSLRDAASGRLGRVQDELRATGKEGRAALKEIDALRRDMRQGFSLTGVGVAGLVALRGGVKVAGDFEAAMSDLRMSIQELGEDGQINLTRLNDQMNRFENLSVRLGNQLPGTTQDFVEMFSVLKQGGLETDTILKGAGEAVANLAVVTGQNPANLAEPFAQYAQQFKLTGEEAVRLADVLARLKFRTGLSPQELIEGSKFFQLRAGAPLGLTGLQGAEISGRLLASLRKAGLEGGIGGRELAGMFERLTFDTKPQQEALGELQRKGIKLEFFDRKGEFLGIDNVFAQLEKLRGLSKEEKFRINKALFGADAVAPANLMIDMGVEGWKKNNAEIDKGAKLQDLRNQKLSTYNAKLEAVLGTAENLAATTFTPILDDLKPGLDAMNELIGLVQQFAKEHPEITGLGVKLLALGSVGATVIGVFKGLTRARQLWVLASSVSSGERGLISFFQATRREAEATGDAVERSGRRMQASARKAGSGIGSVLTGAIKATVVGFAIEQVVGGLIDRGMAEVARRAGEAEVEDLSKERAKVEADTSLSAEERKNRVSEIDKQIGAAIVGMLEATKSGGYWDNPSDFADYVAQLTHGPVGGMVAGRRGVRSYYTEGLLGLFKPDDLAEKQLISLLSGKFKSGEQLTAFFEVLRKSGQYEAEELNSLKNLAASIYPEYASQLMKLGSETETTSKSMQEAARSARWFGENLRSTPFPVPTPSQSVTGGNRSSIPPSSSQTTPPQKFQRFVYPKAAIGGFVEREGLVHVHANETIIPARVTRGFRERAEAPRDQAYRASRGETHLHFHIPDGSPVARDPRALMAYITHQVKRQLERS